MRAHGCQLGAPMLDEWKAAALGDEAWVDDEWAAAAFEEWAANGEGAVEPARAGGNLIAQAHGPIRAPGAKSAKFASRWAPRGKIYGKFLVIVW